MAVNLKKGQRIDLRKSNGDSLRNITVGLGWDVAAPPQKGGFLGLFAPKAPSIDCDAAVLMCQNGKLASNKDIVYFGNLKHSSGAVQHLGDNLTGAGDGDDEQIIVKLNEVPSAYDKLVFVVNIYQPVQRKQHFGMIQNCFIRIIDQDSNTELCRFNLSENYDNKTAMLIAEVYRHNGDWKFNALGEGTADASVSETSRRYI